MGERRRGILARAAHIRKPIGDPLAALTSTDRAESVDSDFAEHVARAHDIWSRVLASAELQVVARALVAAAISVEECTREAETITELPATRRRLEAIRNAVSSRMGKATPGAFERFVLAHTVLRHLHELESAAVPAVVKRLTCTGLLRFADGREAIDLSYSRFEGLCKMATLRRFAAGQFDWERSGFPRSWLPRVRPWSELIGLLAMIAAEWHAFGPAFFAHMPAAFPVFALREGEVLKSYYRMAQAMELQPQIKGLIASAWLHSPATFEVSPHLAWLNSVFARNGALMATMGPAPLDCGVLAQSVERQRAFNDGRFKPTIGLVVWSRRDMLAWAAAHREFGN
jgi:hypothetical protein